MTVPLIYQQQALMMFGAFQAFEFYTALNNTSSKPVLQNLAGSASTWLNALAQNSPFPSSGDAEANNLQTTLTTGISKMGGNFSDFKTWWHGVMSYGMNAAGPDFAYIPTWINTNYSAIINANFGSLSIIDSVNCLFFTDMFFLQMENHPVATLATDADGFFGVSYGGVNKYYTTADALFYYIWYFFADTSQAPGNGPLNNTDKRWAAFASQATDFFNAMNISSFGANYQNVYKAFTGGDLTNNLPGPYQAILNGDVYQSLGYGAGLPLSVQNDFTVNSSFFSPSPQLSRKSA